MYCIYTCKYCPIIIGIFLHINFAPTFDLRRWCYPHSTKMLPNYRWLMPPAANIFTSKDAKGCGFWKVLYIPSPFFLGVYRARGWSIRGWDRVCLFRIFWDQRPMSRESCWSWITQLWRAWSSTLNILDLPGRFPGLYTARHHLSNESCIDFVQALLSIQCINRIWAPGYAKYESTSPVATAARTSPESLRLHES